MSTLTIYMKSGNKIKLRLVKYWKISGDDDVVKSLTIERHWFAKYLPFERLIMTSSILSQIEAVTES